MCIERGGVLESGVTASAAVTLSPPKTVAAGNGCLDLAAFSLKCPGWRFIGQSPSRPRASARPKQCTVALAIMAALACGALGASVRGALGAFACGAFASALSALAHRRRARRSCLHKVGTVFWRGRPF